MGSKRFIGGNIPMALFETFEQARADSGISNRTEAIELAIAMWVEQNPPDGGLPRAIADTIAEIRRVRSVRETLDQAVSEWRVTGSTELLLNIENLAQEARVELHYPDVNEAIKEYHGV